MEAEYFYFLIDIQDDWEYIYQQEVHALTLLAVWSTVSAQIIQYLGVK